MLSTQLGATGCHSCHMGRYLPPNTGEHAPPNPSQKGSYSINLSGGMEGLVDLGGWLRLPSHRRSPIQVLTGSDVEQLQR